MREESGINAGKEPFNQMIRHSYESCRCSCSLPTEVVGSRQGETQGLDSMPMSLQYRRRTPSGVIRERD